MTIPLDIIFLMFFTAYLAMNIFANIWLSKMSDDTDIKNDVIIIYTISLSGNTSNAVNQYLTDTQNDLYNRRDKYLWCVPIVFCV